LKAIPFLVLLLTAGILIYASNGLPNRGDPNAPPHRGLSIIGTPSAGTYYIQHAQEDAHTPNIVTVILADYRGYDTLGELTVIFTAGLICYLLLRRRKA
jgi:multicomponent Na+:H+ antiporter subunit B